MSNIYLAYSGYCITFASLNQTVVLAQLVRAPDCGSGGRGFESRIPPTRKKKGCQ